MVTNEYSCWQTPPLDIMENILQRLNLGDRIRSRVTCKYWKSAPGTPHYELPWLLLPQSQRCSNHCLSFSSSERKIVKLKLPAEVRGSMICGSSKGWLIMGNQKGTMFLLNPISGVLHILPSLRTIPSFKKILKSPGLKSLGAKDFLRGVALLFCHDINSSGHTTVAIGFEDWKGHKTLGLCKLEDQTWSVFQVINDNESFGLEEKILFSRGVLYALVKSEKDVLVTTTTRTLNFANHALKLVLIQDKHEDVNRNMVFDEITSDYCRASNVNYNSELLESTTNEVLVIHQMLDHIMQREDVGNIDDNEDVHDTEDNGNNIIVENQDDIDQNIAGDKGNHENDHGEGLISYTPAMTTGSFRTYKFDPNSNNLLPLQNLGDEALFFGNCNSVSLPASNFPEVERNCIYFAAKQSFQLDPDPEVYSYCEIGIFYLDGERIMRPLRSVERSVVYVPWWLTPHLNLQ